MSRLDVSNTVTREFKRPRSEPVCQTLQQVVALPVVKNEEQDGLAAYIGLAAFEAQNYADAIDYLQQVEHRDSNFWKCRFYLAMAYTHEGRISCGLKEFLHISNWCPDPFLRQRAVVASRRELSMD